MANKAATHHARYVDGVLQPLVVAALERQVRESALQAPHLQRSAAAHRQRQVPPAQRLLEALLALAEPLPRLCTAARSRCAS